MQFMQERDLIASHHKLLESNKVSNISKNYQPNKYVNLIRDTYLRHKIDRHIRNVYNMIFLFYMLYLSRGVVFEELRVDFKYNILNMLILVFDYIYKFNI